VPDEDLEHQKQKDRAVLELLAQNGSDMSQAHDIEHHFVATSIENAHRLERWARLNGFPSSGVQKGRYENETYYWLVLVKPTVPTQENLTPDTTLMHRLAQQYDCEYDGWGCEVVDDNEKGNS
jgi:regulator of RNase E activity RraB